MDGCDRRVLSDGINFRGTRSVEIRDSPSEMAHGRNMLDLTEIILDCEHILRNKTVPSTREPRKMIISVKSGITTG